MNIVERAKKHFDDQPIIKIEIPEWADENGDPTIIYSKPFTMNERQALQKFADGDDSELFVRMIIMKSLDSDGNKLFDMTDKKNLDNHADPSIILRIANLMSKTPSVEEIEGN